MSVVLPRLKRWRSSLARFGRRTRARLRSGPRQAAASRRGLAPASPLLIALLGAIALHLLTLSALQLRQRRQPSLALPLARDDTPELLQFSRQQTRETALAPLSVAALGQLPPPPPPPLAPTTTPPAAAVGPGSRRPANAVRSPQRGSGAGAAASGARRPRASGARSGGVAHQRQRPPGNAAPLDPALNAALAALQRWQGGAAASATAGDSGWPPPQKIEGEPFGLWTRLWEQAIPSAAPAGLPRPLPPGVELRRLDAADAAAAALPESRRLSLLLSDRLLLVWPGGGRLWLLRAPASRTEVDGDPPGSGG